MKGMKMKKLIVALFASATALFASAKVLTQEGFEEGFGSFTGTGGTLVSYGSDRPGNYPYPFSSAGDSYCDIDADGETFNSPSSSAAYFDMNVKFTVRDSVNEGDLEGAKLAVYLNSENKIVVSSGDDDSPYVTDLEVDSSGWARLTIAKVAGGFKVYIDDEVVQENGEDKVFEPINNVGETLQVAFDGKGALDNFVARTTDPFIADEDIAATIGDEGYASYNDALKDALTYKTSSETLTITVDDTEMDGTAAKPYQIATADDLIALKDAVLANEYVRSLNFVQTADIDMTSAGPFAGIGVYDANPSLGTPFTGTYDGQGFKISNVTMTARNYGGIFNQVCGGTIKNLTVENISVEYGATGEYGYAIVGNVGGDGALLQNLVAEGSFLSDLTPGTHNMAGIVVRACGGGTYGALVQNCTNNAAIYGNYTKLAGICAITQYKINGAAITFDGCVNTGYLYSSYKSDNATGLAGIVGYVSDDTALIGCSNTGAVFDTSGINHMGVIGGLVGQAYDHTLTDGGGNSTVVASLSKMIGTRRSSATVNGFQYAAVDNNDVATTVAPPYTLAAGNTYLLEDNIYVSQTPVFTFTEAGTISFDTNLGYGFAGTVDSDRSKLMPVTSEIVGLVTTYRAAAGVASVNDVAYATFAEAVEARNSDDDVVTLLANVPTAYVLDSAGTQKTLKVKKNGFNCQIAPGANDVISYNYYDDVTTCVSKHGVASITVNDVTTNYVSLQAALDAITGRQWRVVLLDSESDGAVVPADCMFYLIPGSFTYGEITFQEGDYITSVTETQIDDVNAVLYSCTPADIVVTIGGVKTFYTMQGANDAIAAAVAGGAGSTIKFRLNGGTYVDLMAASGFEYDSDNDIYTLSAPPVAAVYNNMVLIGNYATLADAVAAADNYQTVKLLDDVTLDARVEPNAYVTIDLCGHTITRTGTSGNGSAFDVKGGFVVITNGVIDCTQDDTDIAKDGVYAITARAGATVILSDLTVRVDSECGACAYPFVNENGVGAYIDIHSGTYENLTTTPYRYKRAWTGMTVNQANKDKMGGYATSLVHISGGRFKGVDPALGDDSWDDGEGSFVMDSCMTVPEGGYYVVRDAVTVSFMLWLETTSAETAFLSVTKILKGTPVARPAQDPSTNGYTFVGWYTRHENPENDYISEWDSDPFDFNAPIVRNTEIWARFTPSGINAGQSQTVEVDTEKDAIDAVTLNITVPEAVAGAVSGLTQSDYQSYFKKVATPGTGADEGKWVVTAELDEDVVFDATPEEESETEQSILEAALDEESTTATVQAAKPGLYYSMEASNDIGFAAGEGTLEGDRTLATGTTVDIEKPNTPSGNAVFFRVKVSRTDK